MPVPGLIRDSFIGQLVYYGSGRRLFQYPEEKQEYILPERYNWPAKPARPSLGTTSESATLNDRASTSVSDERRHNTLIKGDNPHDESAVAQEGFRRPAIDLEKGNFAEQERRSKEEEETDRNVVDWYGPDDSECPMNWSLLKRSFVTFDICFITFSIYIGSAIYAPGIEEISMQFGVSSEAATLGITLFVLGYGLGPMFLSPLSEIPQLGRTSVYIITLLLFVCIQIPTALAKNLAVLLPLRFIAGFIGSPPLATGGASLADMWAPDSRATVIGLWGLAAVCGPVLGPLIGGFAAQEKNWTWTIWILMWLSAAALAFLVVFLPETSSQAILYRRAVRLRRLTGNQELKSQGEIDSAHMKMSDIAMMTLVRPFVLGFREPIVLGWNLYIALVYGILYIFITSFNVVFIELHGFNLGENGLAFMGLFCGALITFIFFVPYCEIKLRPKFRDGSFVPEDRLPVAMLGSIFLPISMFWFGWTSSFNIHWIVPIIGSSFFSIGTFLLFQAGLNYLSDCYPRYVASILAGNDLFRSCVGAAFPLFSTAFFHNLGVGRACSVLGGIAVAMLPIPFILYKYGPRIRKYSKYAD